MDITKELNKLMLNIVNIINTLNKLLVNYKAGIDANIDKVTLLDIRKLISKEIAKMKEISTIELELPLKIKNSFITLIIKFVSLSLDSNDIYLIDDILNISFLFQHIHLLELLAQSKDSLELTLRLISCILVNFTKYSSGDFSLSLLESLMTLMDILIASLPNEPKYLNTPKIISCLVNFIIINKIDNSRLLKITLAILSNILDSYSDLRIKNKTGYIDNLHQFIIYINEILSFLYKQNSYLIEKSMNDEILITYSNLLCYYIVEYNKSNVINKSIENELIFNEENILEFTDEYIVTVYFNSNNFIYNNLKVLILMLIRINTNKTSQSILENLNKTVDSLTLEATSNILSSIFNLKSLISLYKKLKYKQLDNNLETTEEILTIKLLYTSNSSTNEVNNEYTKGISIIINKIVDELINNIKYNKLLNFEIINDNQIQQILKSDVIDITHEHILSLIDKGILLDSENYTVTSYSSNQKSLYLINYKFIRELLNLLKTQFTFFYYDNLICKFSLLEDRLYDDRGEEDTIELSVLENTLMLFSQFSIILYWSLYDNSQMTEKYPYFNKLMSIFDYWKDIIFNIKSNEEVNKLVISTSTISLLLLCYINVKFNSHLLLKQEINTILSYSLIYFTCKESIYKLLSYSIIRTLVKEDNIIEISNKLTLKLHIFINSIIKDLSFDPDASISKLSSLIDIAKYSGNDSFNKSLNEGLLQKGNVLFHNLDKSIYNKDYPMIKIYLSFYMKFTCLYLDNDESSLREYLINVGIENANLFRKLILRVNPLLMINQLVYSVLKIYSNLLLCLKVLPLAREEAENFSAEDPINVTIKSSLNSILYEINDHIEYLIENLHNLKLLIELFIFLKRILSITDYFNTNRIKTIISKTFKNLNYLIRQYSFDEQVISVFCCILEFYLVYFANNKNERDIVIKKDFVDLCKAYLKEQEIVESNRNLINTLIKEIDK